MANLKEQATWELGIYQFETSDPVLGGENGIDNVPTKQLANRTLWLKNAIAEAVADIGNLSTGKANKATTLAGYGISDAYPQTAINNLLAGKANNTVTITGTSGLKGGGALSASQSLTIDKATAQDILDGTANKVVTADIYKPIYDKTVTRDGVQTISGGKTFSATLTAAGTSLIGYASWTSNVKLDGGLPVLHSSKMGIGFNDAEKSINFIDIENSGLACRLSYADGTLYLPNTNSEISISGTKVKEELAKKAAKTLKIDTGNGLTGGGTLEADKTLAIDKATTGNITSGVVNKVVTADILKPILDKLVTTDTAQIITATKTFTGKQAFSSTELAGYASWQNTIALGGTLPALVADNLGIGFYKSESTSYFIDFTAKTYGARINHSTGVVDLNGANSDVLINGLSVKNELAESLKKNNFVVMTGTVAHGATIPLPAGFTADKCTWFVSPADINPSDTTYTPQSGNSKQWRLNCSVNASRVVTAIMTVWTTNTAATTIAGNANYIIIGVK